MLKNKRQNKSGKDESRKQQDVCGYVEQFFHTLNSLCCWLYSFVFIASTNEKDLRNCVFVVQAFFIMEAIKSVKVFNLTE